MFGWKHWGWLPALLILSYGIAVQADPPARVAALSHVHGAVSFAPAGTDRWVSAPLNYPLTTGDNLWTARNARAVVHAGAIAVRMDQHTQVTILDLGNHTLRLSLPRGTINVGLPYFPRGDRIEIATPNSSITVLRSGQYRIDADQGLTRITVWAGKAKVTAASGAVFPVHTDQTARVSAQALDLSAAGAPDAFDAWCFAREQRDAAARRTLRDYVSPDMTGYQTLAEYGSWRTTAEYGPVWIPDVPPGWVPYRYGHWVWIAPWGWTWIDDEPWGFAPFHYGRWVYLNGVWGWTCWAPGVWTPSIVIPPPVYAPALVVFIGDISPRDPDDLGWYPLAPGEPYRPPYPTSPVYIRNINVTNVTVNNVTFVKNVTHVHREVRAVTVVSKNVFVNARPVAPAVIRVPKRVVLRAPMIHLPRPLLPHRITPVRLRAYPDRPRIVINEHGKAHRVGPAYRPSPARQHQRLEASGHTPPPPGVTPSRDLRNRRLPAPPVRITRDRNLAHGDRVIAHPPRPPGTLSAKPFTPYSTPRRYAQPPVLNRPAPMSRRATPDQGPPPAKRVRTPPSVARELPPPRARHFTPAPPARAPYQRLSERSRQPMPRQPHYRQQATPSPPAAPPQRRHPRNLEQ
ncbi:MAG: hypothetical protein KGJ12_07185 [Gammaproteobacteria bacterium]|nr:hypothetical protein [Gammaproteobacteria bacterium]